MAKPLKRRPHPVEAKTEWVAALDNGSCNDESLVLQKTSERVNFQLCEILLAMPPRE